MPILKTDLDTLLQDYLASTQNIKADGNKRTRALNTALDKLQSFGNWLFTIRKTTFTYVAATEEYCIETALLITDFKAVYTIDNAPVLDFRGNNFDDNSVSVRMKDGKHYLNAYLNDGEDDTLDFEYFSIFMAQDKNGVWQSRFTEEGTEEQFIGPTDLKPLIVEMAYYELLRKAKNIDKNERAETLNNIERLRDEAFANFGFTPQKGTKHITIKR